MKFDYTLDFGKTDFREHPELYRVGRGEQGVLLVEPYKTELLPHWRFRMPDGEKLLSARIFRERLDVVLADPAYAAMRAEHKRRHESPPAPPSASGG